MNLLSLTGEWGNRLDFFLFQDSLYFTVFFLSGLAGMLLARIFLRANEEKIRDVEWENSRLEREWAGLDEV
jgi:hypothetical protein